MLTINELQTLLQGIKKCRITYTDIGNALGCGRSNISSRAGANSLLKIDEIKKIEDYFNVTINEQEVNNNYQENVIKAEYYPEVFGSCGSGVFELSQEHHTVEIPKECFFKEISPIKKYSVIRSSGQSMAETIQDNDKLIIEHMDATEPIQDNKIYVFCYDNQIFIKRLIYNIDEIVVISDNQDKSIYKTKFIKKEEMNNFYLIGQVVGLARNLR